MRQIYLSFLFLCAIVDARAQQTSIAEITTSDLYYWGMATANTREEARQKALEELSMKVFVLVRADLTLVDDEKSQSFRSASVASSLVKLRDVGFQEIPVKNRKEFRVLAFVLKESLQVAFEGEKQLLKNRASIVLKNNNVPELLELWGEVFAFPFSVFLADATGKEVDVRWIIENRLAEKLKLAALTFSKPQLNGPAYTIWATIAGESVTPADYVVRIKEPGYGYHQFKTEKTGIFWDILPDRPTMEASFELGFDVNGIKTKENQLAARNLLPTRVFSQDLDFSEAPVIDVKASLDARGNVRLIPLVEGIAIRSIEWLMPDDKKSSEKEQILLASHTVFPISFSLAVNAEAGWTRTYTLNAKGVLSRTNRPGQEKLPVDLPQAPPVITTPVVDVAKNQNPPTPPTLPPFAMFLSQARYYDEQDLKLRAKKGELKFGGRTAVTAPQSAFMLIVDLRENRIIDILGPQTPGGRQSIRTGLISANPAVDFKGFAPVYIEFLKQ